MRNAAEQLPTTSTDTGTGEGRRRLLKLLVAGSAGAAAAVLLPQSWARPRATVGVLPAHAQASGFTGDIQAGLAWQTGGTQVILLLHVVDPVGPEDVSGMDTLSATLRHSGLAGLGTSGNESVANRTPGVVAAGTYQVYLSNGPDSTYLSGGSLTVTLTVNGGAPANFDMASLFEGQGPNVKFRVADVTFPGGIVTNRIGQSYP